MQAFKSALILGLSIVLAMAIFLLFIHLMLLGIALGIVLFCCGWVMRKYQTFKSPKTIHIHNDWYKS